MFSNKSITDEELLENGALKITHVKNRRYIRMPNFPKRATTELTTWLADHLENPYPSQSEKERLCAQTGLSKKQIQNWLTNARKRNWQPMLKKQQQKDTFTLPVG